MAAMATVHEPAGGLRSCSLLPAGRTPAGITGKRICGNRFAASASASGFSTAGGIGASQPHEQEHAARRDDRENVGQLARANRNRAAVV